MLCPICAREFEEGSVICPNCEVRLIEQETGIGEPAPSPAPDAAVAPKPSKLACPLCGGTDFLQETGYLPLKEPGLLRFPSQDQEIVIRVCNGCGYILSFIDLPGRFRDQPDLTDNFGNSIDYETSEAKPDECPICFTRFKPGDSYCTNCGRKLGS